MPVVEESGLRLEYVAQIELASVGGVDLRATVSPPNVNHQIWFYYGYDGGEWQRGRATRHSSSVRMDNYGLTVKTSEGHEKLRFIAILRRGPLTVPRRFRLDRGKPPDDLRDLVVDVPLSTGAHPETTFSMKGQKAVGDKTPLIEPSAPFFTDRGVLPTQEAMGILMGQGSKLVLGEVRKADGTPVPGAVVKAFHKHIQGEQLLGESRTGKDGHYQIALSPVDDKQTVNLLVKAFDSAGVAVAASPLVFGAGDEETVNLVPGGGEFRGASDFEKTAAELSDALKGVPPAEVTDEQKAFVERDAGLDRREIELHTRAGKVAKDTGLDAEALYAMYKMGLPTDLNALLAQPRKAQKYALKRAVERNAVSAQVQERIEPILKRLRELGVAKVLAEGADGRPSPLKTILSTVLADDQQQAFVEKYVGHTGAAQHFWTALSQDPSFKETAQEVKESLQFAAITRNHAPLMKELQRRRKAGAIGGVKDLAAWSEGDWNAMLDSQDGREYIGAPDTIPGKDAAEKKERYARALAHLLERAYPSTAALGRLAKGTLEVKKDLAVFARSNPAFDLGGAPVEKYLAENPNALDGVANAVGFSRSLNEMHRVFKFAPTAGQIEALLKDGVTSAHQVTAIGRDNFTRTYAPKWGAGPAKSAWEKASIIHGAAMNLMIDNARVFDTAIMVVNGQANKLMSKPAAGVPDWEALFGSMDLCECEHCRSVLSPAAYFTDALHFLSQRASKTSGKSVKDVLLARRPDLGNIELTCQNTNTVLPYVDLANEILEEAISPGTGTPLRERQTVGTAEELAANPGHMNAGAYDKLRAALFPGRLPFDVWTDEARIYLDHLGVSRADLMKVLQKPGPVPTAAAVAAERLGLTRAERLIVTAQYAVLNSSSPPNKWNFWGFSDSDGWVEETAKLRPFMKKAGLTYNETTELLKARFVNPDASLQVVPAPGASVHTGDTSLLLIDNLSEDALDRVQRFLRLWRRTGWTMFETDAAITLLSADELDVNKRITDDLLAKLADIQVLKGAWRLPVESLLTFWAPIDVHGEDSQYRRLFQNRAVTQPVDEDFVLSNAELAIVAADPSHAKISSHGATILASLTMTAQELAVLAARTLPDDTLTRANLSALHRHVLLARALKMSVADLVSLKDLSGINPFDPADTGATILFKNVAAKVKASGQDVNRLEYLLRHRIAPASGLGPVPQTQALVLSPMRAGLRSIAETNAFPDDPARINETFLRERLSFVLEADAVEKVLALVTDENWTDAPAKNAVVDDHLAFLLDTDDAKRKLVGPPPALPHDRTTARIQYVLAPLLAHLVREESEALVKQTLADALPLEAETVAGLLTQWVDAVSDTTKKALAEFLDPTFAASDPQSQPMTAANFPAVFKLLTRLEKIASIVAALKMTSSQAARVLSGATAAGWLNPAALPAVAGDPPASFSAWERLADLFALKNEIPGGWDTVASLFALADAPAVLEPAFLDAVSQASGWNRNDVATLVGSTRFQFAFPTAYRDERALIRLKEGFLLLKRLGVSAAQATEWIGEEVTKDQARAAKQAAAAKYDPAEWLRRAKPLRDILRERQRAALVDYLIPRAGADQTWGNTNDLYAYFLIDVEMSPCMMTSRIKQAILSTQLFVQRCFLNLEADVNADAAADHNWPQWNDWMKNYRVWEANRKIFLWPENWIIPAFLDTKSPFFEDFQNELLQGEVTVDTAEAAFKKYLEKLDEVDRLEVVGMYHQQEADDAGQIAVDLLHVVARTHSDPRRHFYRRRENGEAWTPWEKIDLDIQADQVVPVVWNRRLYMLWPFFTELQKDTSLIMAGPGAAVPQHPRTLKIQLFWSEFQDGAWAQPRLSDDYVESYQPDFVEWLKPENNFSFRAFVENDELVVRVYRASYGSSSSSSTSGGVETVTSYQLYQFCLPLADFRFSGCEGLPRLEDSPEDAPPLALPKETIRKDSVFTERVRRELIPVDADDRLYLTEGDVIYQRSQSWFLNPDNFENKDDVLTLNRTPGYFDLLTPHQDPQFNSTRPFFYRDRLRTFHIVPEKKEVITGYRVEWIQPENLEQFWEDPVWNEPPPVDPLGPIEVGGRTGSIGSDPIIRGDGPFTDVGPSVSLPVEGWRITPSYPLARSSGAANGSSPSGGVLTAEVAEGGHFRRGEGTSTMLLSRPPVRSGPAGRSLSMMRSTATTDGSAPAGGGGAGGTVVVAKATKAEWKTSSEDYVWVPSNPTGKIIPIYSTKTFFEFQPFYHPFVCQFKKELRRDGLDGLLQRKLQVWPHLFIPSPTPFSFSSEYLPEDIVKEPYPVEDVDFTARGAYSLYNWELFFHAPLMIAEKLSQNQRFADAQKWFHYIFNPTDASAHPSPQRYWQMGFFFNTTTQNYQDQKIENIMNLLATGAADEELTAQVRSWRENPFNPYLVARLRTVAFQKAVVMKYLDNLIEWGDFSFRNARDPEQINEATQLYILAAEILGSRPEIVKPRALPVVKTYNEIEPDLDEFSNALVAAEALVPAPPDGMSSTTASTPVTLPALLYFCIPKNGKLLAYWDTVADRLSKIRNCRNIEGQEFKLPLFEPAIDPALLIKARAAGLDLSSVLSDLNAPPPHYRFQVLSQKATEFAQEVKSLGASLLRALEQRDAEALALLRAGQEISLLDAVQKVREDQIKEADENSNQLEKYKDLVTLRQKYYQDLLSGGLNDHEVAERNVQYVVMGLHSAQAALDGVAGTLHLIPEAKGGSPCTVGVTWGGSNIASGLQGFASLLASTAAAVGAGGSVAGLSAGWARRGDEWQHQVDVGDAELAQVDRQIAAAEVRTAITVKELANHKKQISNAKESEEFLQDKFTNKQLYDWMVSQLSAVHFQAYKLAYDMAKRAELAYRNELGLADSSFIQFGYWDGLKKGLMAGEKLFQDIKRLEASFLDNNRREYELTKHVSLALMDPVSLVQLKQTGECFISLPEAIFDLDHPGHYFRRLRSVSLTIPAVIGPYQGVHATLTLMKSSLRHDATTGPGGYVRTGPDDLRFRDTMGPLQSVATSHGANDSGLHELSFRDERYLPFEGRGVVSEWKLTVDLDSNRWDFNTLMDVILHVNYTARDGGEQMRQEAKDALPVGGVRLFSMRHEFSTEWHRFVNPAEAAVQQDLVFDLRDRFPYDRSGKAPKITGIEVYLKIRNPPADAADIPVALFDNPSGTGANLLETQDPPPAPQNAPPPLKSDDALARIHHAGKGFTVGKNAGEWMLRFEGAQIPAFLAETVTVDGSPYKHLNRDLVEDVYVAVTFERP